MRRWTVAGALLVALTTSCDPPRRRDRARGDATVGTSSASSTRTASVAEAEPAAPPPPPTPKGPRVALVSDLSDFDIRAFRRRSRLRLPRYKKTMKTFAAKYGFDWRLIAAIAYVESHFNPLAKSQTGVRGLMQLTRITAKSMDVSNRLDPHQSIRGGVRYLDRLHGHFDEIVEFHRTIFAMASYNVGYGHVRDAQRLARRRGRDPRVWQSLRQTLPLLSNEEIAALTRYGRARGYEPVAYVRSICNYFVLQKRDACRRRDQLGRLVLGELPATVPPRWPERLLTDPKDGVVTLAWSHPYVCAIDDCHVLASLPPDEDPSQERAAASP